MFHRETDASKVAFASLVECARAAGFRLFDVQLMTPHLASLGCIEIPREQYLRELAAAVDLARAFPRAP
jgi:leucyl/phenylalanyl-tRNA--protein transferase